jgi:hypothetical protein
MNLVHGGIYRINFDIKEGYWAAPWWVIVQYRGKIHYESAWKSLPTFMFRTLIVDKNGPDPLWGFSLHEDFQRRYPTQKLAVEDLLLYLHERQYPLLLEVLRGKA